ncbi:hypothetical protein CJ030_MR2G001432 [Morella rubra]|uniref:Uncharacterized protein n=1 Tax=Morella rubra TaxID=262757 RepID=A0A6A1WKD2_9ROSI|nr:hypothetical protein CJ030_MR2G001432 [Morella rubra]
MAHMKDVTNQLEDVKKTLEDFMTEDPQKIPGDIPDDVATFHDDLWQTISTLTTPSGGREDGGRDYDDGTSNAPQPNACVFQKVPSKEAALLKPHPDTTEEQWKELCDLFTSEAFMKRSEQNKKNRSKLTVNHAVGSRSFQRTRACERMDAFQRQCDLEGKTYTEIKHQLAKVRDEIEGDESY